MKIALCISGQMRTYLSCFPSLKKFVIDPLRPDIFIHTWSDLGVSNHPEGNAIVPKGPKATVDPDFLRELYGAIEVVVEGFPSDGSRCLFGITVPAILQEKEPDHYKGALPMFYKMAACNELKKDQERKRQKPYDLVIRLRPDISFNDYLPIGSFDGNGSIWCSDLLVDMSFQVSDKLAFGCTEDMDLYSSVWHRLEEYWQEPLGNGDWENFRVGERLMKHHLHSVGLNVVGFSLDCNLLRPKESSFSKVNRFFSKMRSSSR